MSAFRKILALLTVLGVAAALMGPALAADGGAENEFLKKINAERASRGLGQLTVYADLKDDARAHSQRMMNQQKLYHNPNLAGVTTGWQALGENVGVGPFVGALHEAFMSSPAHRSNILGDYNYVGVGVVRESDTKMWVTVVFMRGPSGLAGGGNGDGQQTTTTTAPPPPATTTTTTAPPPPEPQPTSQPEPQPVSQPAPAPTKAPPSQDVLSSGANDLPEDLAVFRHWTCERPVRHDQPVVTETCAI